MGAIRFLFRIAVILLILVLPSCGAYETISSLVSSKESKRKQSGSDTQARYRQPTRGPSGEPLVTLKPPYTGWTWEDDDYLIGVGNAVEAVCRQVGIRYNQKKSYANTAPACRNMAHPNFENKPWKEAIAEILAPVNLTFVIENNQVVLMKVDDARKREAAVGKLKAEMAQYLASAPKPPVLHDAVIIFPLLDDNGRTTELGTLLSELGMLKATYIPEKAFNLHLPALLDLYQYLGYTEPGASPSKTDMDRLRQRFETKDTASGKMKFDSNSAFSVVLNFDGQHGKKEFSMTGAKNDLNNVPQWIASCIHGYCRTRLSPEQEKCVNLPEITDSANLNTLVGLERDFLGGKRDLGRWNRLLRFNPDSAFIPFRYYLACEGEDRDDSLDYITAALRDLGNHGLLKFTEADWHHRTKKYENAAPLFFELLKRDLRNEEIYRRLDEELIALDMGENAESLHGLWETRYPNSYLPLLSKGVFFLDYALSASTITEEGRGNYAERLPLAEQYLTRAHELIPEDPRSATSLIMVARRLGYPRDQMEKWFNKAVEADPKYYDAYRKKLDCLTPEWSGGPQEMFAFARECAANPPAGSRVAFILADAHAETARRFPAKTHRHFSEYYLDPRSGRN